MASVTRLVYQEPQAEAKARAKETATPRRRLVRRSETVRRQLQWPASRKALRRYLLAAGSRAPRRTPTARTRKKRVLPSRWVAVGVNQCADQPRAAAAGPNRRTRARKLVAIALLLDPPRRPQAGVGADRRAQTSRRPERRSGQSSQRAVIGPRECRTVHQEVCPRRQQESLLEARRQSLSHEGLRSRGRLPLARRGVI